MRKLTFTNSRGASIVFERGGSFLFKNPTGLGDVEADVQMQRSPYQHGSTFIEATLKERYITLDVTIKGSGDNDISAKRQFLSSIFNPILGEGVLVYQYGDVIREIRAVSEHVPVFLTGEENRNEGMQRSVVSLVAPNPLWEDINPENYKLEDFVGNFRFPFRFKVRFAARGDSKLLINKGNVPTPIKVEFRGPVTNPRITNLTTGEFIRVKREIPDGFKLILDTKFGNKRVEIIGPDGVVQNAFHYIDLDSEFFNLDVGENRFGFIADSGNPEVYVEYKHRYLSV